MDNNIKQVKAFLKDYILEFSNFKTEKIIKKYTTPSVLISQEYSKLFLNEKDIDLYYKSLFLVLKTLKYKFTKINKLQVNTMPPDNTENTLYWIYLNADRYDVNNKLIVNLNCNYMVEKSPLNELKFTFVKCSR